MLFTCHSKCSDRCIPMELCLTASSQQMQKLIACITCRPKLPPSPQPAPYMYPSHPHQGLARAEGLTCSAGMAAGTSVGFWPPSRSGLSLSLSPNMTSLLPLRYPNLPLLCSQMTHLPSSCSSLVETSQLYNLVASWLRSLGSTCSLGGKERRAGPAGTLKRSTGQKKKKAPQFLECERVITWGHDKYQEIEVFTR